MTKPYLALAASLFSLLLHSGVAAQACVGIPQGSRGALYGSLGLPSGAKDYSLFGMTHVDDSNAFVGLGFGVISPDAEGLDNTRRVGTSVTFEVRSLAPRISLCPTGTAYYSVVGDRTSWVIPFGVGVGTTFRPGAGYGGTFTSYAVPHFTHSRVTEEDGAETARETVFGLLGGVVWGFGPLYLGASISRVLEAGAAEVFTAVVGASW